MKEHTSDPNSEKRRFWLSLSDETLCGPKFHVHLRNASSHRERLSQAREGLTQRLSQMDTSGDEVRWTTFVLWESLNELKVGGLSREEAMMTIKSVLKSHKIDARLGTLFRSYRAAELFGTAYFNADDDTREALDALVVENKDTGEWEFRPEKQEEIDALNRDMSSGAIPPSDILRSARRILR